MPAPPIPMKWTGRGFVGSNKSMVWRANVNRGLKLRKPRTSEQGQKWARSRIRARRRPRSRAVSPSPAAVGSCSSCRTNWPGELAAVRSRCRIMTPAHRAATRPLRCGADGPRPPWDAESGSEGIPQAQSSAPVIIPARPTTRSETAICVSHGVNEIDDLDVRRAVSTAEAGVASPCPSPRARHVPGTARSNPLCHGIVDRHRSLASTGDQDARRPLGSPKTAMASGRRSGSGGRSGCRYQ